MYGPRYTTLFALLMLALVGLLALPMWLHTSETIIYADQAVGDASCLNLQSEADGPTGTTMTRYPTRCTPTPRSTREGTPIPTNTRTQFPTDTPSPTFIPTNTATPMYTATTTSTVTF